MKTTFFSLVIFFFMTCSLAVIAQKDPIKWGKLLKEDLAMKSYAADEKASAVVLCDYGTVSVGPRTNYTRHIRIKILKEAGIAAASVEIPYKPYDNYEKFSGLKAQTLNMNDKGEIIKSKLKHAAIGDIEIDARHHKKVFRFPDVKAGSIIEYSYTINSLDLVRLNNWYFQSPLPTVWSEYRVYIPKRFNYLVTFQKGRGLDETEQQQYAGKLQWLYNTSINSAYAALSKDNYLLYESGKKTSKVYLARGQNLRFVMDNMPAVNASSKNQAITDLMPLVKVHLYLADGFYPFYFRRILIASKEEYEAWDNSAYYSTFHPGFVIYWLPTWEEATDKWLNDEHLGQRLEKKIKPVKGSADSLNSIEGIFSYVKQNTTWNGTYSMYADHKLNDVLKKKIGSSGELNLLLIDMLQKAGFEVSPVLVRTMELGRVENIYPERSQFNHVIAQVIVNGQVEYLDATGSDKLYDLPANVQSTQGWLLKSKGYGWVNITNTKKELLEIKKEPAKKDAEATFTSL